MIAVTGIEEVRACVNARRSRNDSIALVPTMGNLHQGHRALIQSARASSDFVVVSLYVNPFQFAPTEDLASYPRTLEQDRLVLAEEGVDLLFMPGDAVMYPRGLDEQTRVEVPGLSAILEGVTRPAFFRGVTTVVNRLFNIVSPDCAYFGKKDYQQWVIIQRMVDDLAMNIVIKGVDTVRDSDGLALSSRNSYLNEAERKIAPALYRGLQSGVEQVRSGDNDFEGIEHRVTEQWAAAGIKPDYALIRTQHDLRAINIRSRDELAEGGLVILGAGWVGSTRLIDNVEFAA